MVLGILLTGARIAIPLAPKLLKTGFKAAGKSDTFKRSVIFSTVYGAGTNVSWNTANVATRGLRPSKYNRSTTVNLSMPYGSRYPRRRYGYRPRSRYSPYGSRYSSYRSRRPYNARRYY